MHGSNDGAAAEKTLPICIPRSLWHVVSHTTSEPWPPTSSHAATAFVSQAKKEQLLPLLYADSSLPESVRQAAAAQGDAYRAHLARSTVIHERLQKAVQLLNSLGEEFIVLKGCDFGYRLYPKPHLRSVSDIDILVRDGEMERVARRLKAEGLTRFYPGNLSSRVETHHETAIGFGTVVIDLHQRFAQKQRHRIDYDGVWKRAVRLETAGFTALRLSDADALVYLTLSMAIKYLNGPLIHYVDLWLLLQSNPGCLTEAEDLARQWRARRAFYASLSHGARFFPEMRDDLAPVLDRILGRKTAGFLDRFVVPRTRPAQKTLSRSQQLWRKFWLVDNATLRAQSFAEHAAATIRGFLARRRDHR